MSDQELDGVDNIRRLVTPDGRIDGAYGSWDAYEAPGVQQVSGKKTQWPFPHYSNPVWKEPQTVFGREARGLEYVYDDRLMQWDWDAWNRGREAADQVATKRTAAWWEACLSAYHGYPVELVHAQAGVNWSNGFPYYVLGFRKTAAAEVPGEEG